MQTLRNIISRYMRTVTLLLVIAILALILYFQIVHERTRAYEAATETFRQIEQLLEQNQEELAETREAYRQTCLHNAEAIAYIIEDNPFVLDRSTKSTYLIPLAVFMREHTRNTMILPLTPANR